VLLNIVYIFAGEIGRASYEIGISHEYPLTYKYRKVKYHQLEKNKELVRNYQDIVCTRGIVIQGPNIL
jgi:hypothetical protein